MPDDPKDEVPFISMADGSTDAAIIASWDRLRRDAFQAAVAGQLTFSGDLTAVLLPCSPNHQSATSRATRRPMVFSTARSTGSQAPSTLPAPKTYTMSMGFISPAYHVMASTRGYGRCR